MFRDYSDTFSDYLIEKSFLCDTYLIPGKILEKVLTGMEKRDLKLLKVSQNSHHLLQI